ncbi:MAG: hypothetical protein V3R54_07425 [Thermodesulfovibrionia bacterium]
MKHYGFLDKLEKQIDEILKTKDRVLISVVGKGGTGKSFFGKYIKNYGCCKFSKRNIAVIDDGVLWVDFLFFFRRTIKIKNAVFDELQPFLKKLSKRKKIIFYINATPWERISRADILLMLSTDENTRKKRLQQRYNSIETINKFLTAENITDYKIKYTYLVKGEV